MSRLYEPPTDEQLGRFIAMRIRTTMGQWPDERAVEALLQDREIRDSALAQHREWQEAIWAWSAAGEDT